jgi:hypothetical protein
MSVCYFISSKLTFFSLFVSTYYCFLLFHLTLLTVNQLYFFAILVVKSNFCIISSFLEACQSNHLSIFLISDKTIRVALIFFILFGITLFFHLFLSDLFWQCSFISQFPWIFPLIFHKLSKQSYFFHLDLSFTSTYARPTKVFIDRFLFWFHILESIRSF